MFIIKTRSLVKTPQAQEDNRVQISVSKYSVFNELEVEEGEIQTKEIEKEENEEKMEEENNFSESDLLEDELMEKNVNESGKSVAKK